MSMELFFVVVAVDPRWLFAALDQHHRRLLTDTVAVDGTGAAARALSGRALDYLDKIFQVPFALRPVGGRGPAYLRSLLPDPEPEPAAPPAEPPAASRGVRSSFDAVPSTGSTSAEEAVEGSGPPPSPVPAAPPAAVVPRASEPRQENVGSGPRPSDGVRQTPAVPIPAPVSWVAQNLRLSVAETEFLPRLAGLLPTPRAMKKFTNLYRLLRLSVPAADVPAFRGDRATGCGPYQAAALLLAILAGDPGHADDLFTDLTARDDDPEAPGDVVDALCDDHLGGVGEEAPRATCGPAAQRLITTITALRADDVPVHGEVATYRQWAHAAARFSFETYHLYTDPTSEDARLPTSPVSARRSHRGAASR